MNSPVAFHEFFEHLCAMSAANQASLREEALLAEHLQSCPSCREYLQQYKQIVIQTLEEAPLSCSAKADGLRYAPVDPIEHGKAKAKLLEAAGEWVPMPVEAGPSVDRPPMEIKRTRPWTAWFRAPAWAAWAFAACSVLTICGVSAHYWWSGKPTRTAVTAAGGTAPDPSGLQKEVEELRLELAKTQSDRQELLAKSKSGPAEEDQHLKMENEELRQSLSKSEADRSRKEHEYDSIQDRMKLLQASLDVLQASNTALESDKVKLLQKVSALTAGLRQSELEMARVDERNQELARESLTRIHFVERQQKLLATDHDLRDILGARSLRIIDVYDVGTQGETEEPFGRIFYTQGKSLIFYAFDLDKQKGLKPGVVFQAWGDQAEGKDTPRSLGAFYMDDPSQNRWILKVDDTKLLSRIDYVFVTDNSHKEGKRPKGKPLLSAFLDTRVNHP